MDLLILQFKQFAKYCRENGMGGDEVFESECQRMLYTLNLKNEEIERLIETFSDCESSSKLSFIPTDPMSRW